MVPLLIGIAFAVGTLGVLMMGWRAKQRDEAMTSALKSSATSYRPPWHLEAGRTRERMMAADRGYGE